MIECETILGGKKLVKREVLIIRPSVYAVIKNKNKVLLIRNKATGKYFFPGGGVEKGESLEIALKREVIEETGIKVKVNKFLKFKERFFYYNPLKEAYQSYLFFYDCKPLTFKLLKDEEVEDDEAEKPRWYDLDDLLKKSNKKVDKLVRNILKLI